MNILARPIKSVAVLALLVGVCVSTAFGCGCAGLDPNRLAEQLELAVKDADVVFLGDLEKLDYISGIPNKFLEKERETTPGLTWETKTAVFKVDRWWKGPVDLQTLIIMDATRNSDGTRSGSDCDPSFEKGKTYLVFAWKRAGYLRSSACAFNQERENPLFERVLPLLGEGKKPVKPNS